MNVFDQSAYDDHEQVVFCRDRASGLHAIIAIHDTTLGPSLGGCRMWPYANAAQALTDALRLSRGMTYKSAIAGLTLGGGKSVIIGDPRRDKSTAMLEAFGRFVDNLGGRYIVAEDSGTSVADIQTIGHCTRHVAGVCEKLDAHGAAHSGDPSPATAFGVLTGIEAAVRHQLGQPGLAGVRIAIQGVGNVGRHLARLAHEAGAVLTLADLYPEQVHALAEELGATIVPAEEVLYADVDVLAPCAMGAVLNDTTAPRIRAAIVAGSANNQLADARHGDLLRERGILYAPDYVINAGGLIDASRDCTGRDCEWLLTQLIRIGDTLTEIFERADHEGVSTHRIADRMAEQRISRLH